MVEEDRWSLWSRLLFRNLCKPSDRILKVGRDYWKPGRGRASSLRELLTPEEFPRWYASVKDRGNAWISVCYYTLELSEEMNMVCHPSYFDMIVYDMDIPLPKDECVKLREEDPSRFSSLLSSVRAEALKLYHHLAGRYGCTPLFNFTGNRGYQVWLFLDKPIPASYYRMAFRYYLAGLTLGRELDPSVEEPARLVRLPYTKHECGGLCLPLDVETLKPLKLEETVSMVKPASTKTFEGLISIKPISIPRRLVIDRRRAGSRRSLPEDPRQLLEEMAPPCMEAIWSKMKENSRTSYNEKLALAWFLQNLGYRDDAIVEVFKHMVDFKEEKTRYYLEHSRNSDGSPRYRMFKCSTMRARGLCIDCGYDRNPVSWVYHKLG